MSDDEILRQIKAIGPYGYVPNAGAAAFFTVVFALESIALTYYAIKGRAWWMLGTLALGAALEAGGHAIRIYSHSHADIDDPYIAQQVLLVITPVLFVAAHFTILSKLIAAHTPNLISPIKPKVIIIGFVLIDVISLIVQAVGSALAATAEEDYKSVSEINGDGHIVIGGLALQLFGYLTFNILFITFWKSVKPDKVDRKFLIASYVSALLILVRSIFRTIEMSIGWIGPVAVTEWYFLVFDALVVAIAVAIFIFISPVLHLPRVSTSSAPHSSSSIKLEVA